MSELRLSGRVAAAARALSGISQKDLAAAAGLSVSVLRALERAGSAWISPKQAEALTRAYAQYGVVILEEGDGFGAGVRLKFTRQDVRQIVRLEGEGGIVAYDDAP